MKFEILKKQTLKY